MLILCYSCSEVRLNEALENACTNVLDYKVHKDKVKALRYEKSKYEQPCVKVKWLKKKLQGEASLEHGSSKALDPHGEGEGEGGWMGGDITSLKT